MNEMFSAFWSFFVAVPFLKFILLALLFHAGVGLLALFVGVLVRGLRPHLQSFIFYFRKLGFLRGSFYFLRRVFLGYIDYWRCIFRVFCGRDID